jgi:hypothetical protein
MTRLAQEVAGLLRNVLVQREIHVTATRGGAHNIWENRPGSLAFHSDRLVVGSFFAGGVRVFDISDPARPREVAYDVPPPLPRGHRRGRSRSTTSTGTTAG